MVIVSTWSVLLLSERQRADNLLFTFITLTILEIVQRMSVVLALKDFLKSSAQDRLSTTAAHFGSVIILFRVFATFLFLRIVLGRAFPSSFARILRDPQIAIFLQPSFLRRGLELLLLLWCLGMQSAFLDVVIRGRFRPFFRDTAQLCESPCRANVLAHVVSQSPSKSRPSYANAVKSEMTAPRGVLLEATTASLAVFFGTLKTKGGLSETVLSGNLSLGAKPTKSSPGEGPSFVELVQVVVHEANFKRSLWSNSFSRTSSRTAGS